MVLLRMLDGLQYFMRWRVDHQVEALLGGRQLWDIVFGMRSADVLLHGAEALFL